MLINKQTNNFQNSNNIIGQDFSNAKIKKQTNNFQNSNNIIGQDFSNAKIKKQNNFFLFKLSPLFIKMFNDFYDVRKAIVRFGTFTYVLVCFVGLVVTLYIFKIKGNDLSFDLISTFLLSIIILVFYNFFNNIFYKEFDKFKKSEKIIFLLFFDLVVWGFLSYLIL